MNKILILFAHPAFQKSRVNRHLVEGLREMEGITFHDLYEAYPEFDIDVQHEQELLLQHHCVILQHPMFWYSTPAIMKEWQDLVLEHGWAYGSNGTMLENKLFFNAITTGGPQQAYKAKGYNKHTINELLAPIRQTAALCNMIYLPPYAVHGAHAIEPNEITIHKNGYRDLLQEIINDRFDLERALKLEYLNDYNPEASHA